MHLTFGPSRMLLEGKIINEIVRLLVGLRWWSKFTRSGREVWKFESKPLKNSPIDSTIFWTFQLGATIAWSVFAVLNLLTFSVTKVYMSNSPKKGGDDIDRVVVVGHEFMGLLQMLERLYYVLLQQFRSTK